MKEPHVRYCLLQIALWACRWHIFLIANWYSRSQPPTSEWCRPWVGGPSRKQASKQGSSIIFISVLSSCLGSLQDWLTWKPNKAFPTLSCFQSVFYQSSGKASEDTVFASAMMSGINRCQWNCQYLIIVKTVTCPSVFRTQCAQDIRGVLLQMERAKDIRKCTT